MIFDDFPRYISSSTIAKNIIIENNSMVPRIIISVATVRSGTTATLRVFAESGIKSYRQPFKTIARSKLESHRNNGDEIHWTIPDEDCIYVKETLGPHTIYESLMNPIDIIIQVLRNTLTPTSFLSGPKIDIMGLVRSKLHLIIIGRNPVDAWHSNYQSFQKLVRYDVNRLNLENQMSEMHLLRNFILAYQQVDNIKRYANHLGIPVSHYLFEANKFPKEAFKNLFKRIQIKQEPKITGWTEKSIVGGKNSNVYVLSDYDKQREAGLHDRVNASDCIDFYPRECQSVSEAIINNLHRGGLFEIYDEWKKCAENELGISIN